MRTNRSILLWHDRLGPRLRSLFTPSIAPLDRLGYQLFFGLASIAIATGLAFILEPALHLSGIVSVYFLVVVIAAYWGGIYSSGLTVILAVALLNFFFIEPRHTLLVETPQSWATLAGLLIVSSLMTSLTFHIQRARQNAESERSRSNTAREMLEELISISGSRDIQIRGCEFIFDQLRLPCQIVELREKELTCVMACGNSPALDDAAVRFSLSRNRAIGPWSGELNEKAFWCVPLGHLGESPCAAVVFFDIQNSHITQSQNLQGEVTYQFFLLLAQQIKLALKHEQSLSREKKALRDKEDEALRNTLLASVAHDLRNPLSSILGAATSLISTDLDLSASRRRRLLSSIRDEALQISKVTDNVLTMVRLQVGSSALKADWQSVEEIVGSVISRHQRRESEAKLQFQTNITPDLPLVWGDAALLSQLIDNLIDNAQKYASDNVEILISAVAEDDCVELIVEDNGPGFPGPILGQISEKFIRGSDSNEKPGFGLGLAICESIVHAHKGSLALKNRESGCSGAVVLIKIPTERQGRRAPRATAYHR